ncbi:MAG: hypothetical protein WA093_03365 [Minisyncoccales bacterium]
MYGMPAKRFDPDIYKDRKKLKVNDFSAGFLCGLIFWFLSFGIAWYIAPLIIAALCGAGLFLKFRRRYFIYGALALIFFPFVIWATLIWFYAGRNEIKS